MFCLWVCIYIAVDVNRFIFDECEFVEGSLLFFAAVAAFNPDDNSLAELAEVGVPSPGFGGGVVV